MVQVCCTCLISFVCSTLLTWRHLHSLATPGEDRRENSHSQEGVLWIHLLGQEDKRELFCWMYQWLNPNTAYLWQSTRISLAQHPGSLGFEESPYSYLCTILPIPSSPRPVSLLDSKGCSLFHCGANAHTESTLILIPAWWILRNIIP